MDLIHKLTNLVDHNRGTVAGLLVLAASLALGACATLDGVVTSSTSGEKLDQDGLRAEYIQHSNELQSRYDAAAKTIREANAEIESIERDAEQLNVNYEADNQLAQGEIDNRAESIGALAKFAAQAAGIPWLIPLTSIGTTATAAGAVYDNRRKDKIIKKQKTEIAAA